MVWGWLGGGWGWFGAGLGLVWGSGGGAVYSVLKKVILRDQGRMGSKKGGGCSGRCHVKTARVW